MKLFSIFLMFVAVVLSCGGPREIKVEQDGKVLHRTPLGPALVPGGVLFRVNPPSGTWSLSVAGDFNQWDPTATRLTNDPVRRVWSGFAPLEHKGQILFKYIRNGSDWLTDPLLDSVADGYGGHNSRFDLDKAAKP